MTADTTDNEVVRPKRAKRKRDPFADDYVRKAYIAAQARLQLHEQQIEALHFVLRDFQSGYNTREDERARESADPLFARIYARLVRAQRDVLAFGALAGGDALHEAKYMAYLHFLNSRYEIMHLLNSHGHYPGSYPSSEREAFEAQIAAAVKCTHGDHEHGDCRAPEMASTIHDLEQRLRESKERYEAYVGELTSFDRDQHGS